MLLDGWSAVSPTSSNMRFNPTELPGAFLIEPELIEDERGFFARTWSKEEFEQRQLNSKIAQCSISFNAKRGTVRGLHYQIPPHEETKLVRCSAGKILDVIVDLRRNSRTFKSWASFELSCANRHMLYIPAGFAHGFQTLEENTEVVYQISEYYHPESARGVRWNDPLLNINWPLPVAAISERDKTLPLINEAGIEVF
jgi:dTDP-4-dehydrorhamnose 3,5-epimerase